MPKIQGYWAKPWHGYLYHFWIPGGATLCGKTHMLAHRLGSWHALGRGTCKHCKLKHTKLLAEQEKETNQ